MTVGNDRNSEEEHVMTESTSHARGAISMPADHAFVVQFRPGLGPVATGGGRAEHLISGRAATFTTLIELEQFVEACFSPTAHSAKPFDRSALAT
jgi:hypothetical protein